MTQEEIDLARAKHRKDQQAKENKKYRAHYESLDRGPEGPASDYAPEAPDFSHEERSLFEKLLSFLIPPKPTNTDALWRYNWSVSLCILFFFFHVAFACGYLDRFGMAGFAKASDVSDIKEHYLRQDTRQLAKDINDTFFRQCTTQTQEGRQFWWGKVQDLLREYQELTHTSYPQLPPCEAIK